MQCSFHRSSLCRQRRLKSKHSNYVIVGRYFFATTDPLDAKPLLAFCNRRICFFLSFRPVIGHTILSFTNESKTSSDTTCSFNAMTGCVVIVLCDTAHCTFPSDDLSNVKGCKSFKRNGSPEKGDKGLSGGGSGTCSVCSGWNSLNQ